jgi:inorganic pyrophosphatase
LSKDEIKELKQIVENIDISEDEVEEILEKIEELEDIEDIDSYLPKEFRITTDEYKQSLIDDIVRIKTLTKLNTALTILSEQVNSDS